GIRMIVTGAIDILVQRNDPPGGVRVSGNGFLHRFLVLGRVVVVGIEHDEDSRAIAVVIVAAGLGQTVLGLVGVVEVVGIVRVERVMVADRGGNRQAGQNRRVQVGGVLLLLGLAGLVDLVTGRDHKVEVGVFLGRNFQGTVPAIPIIAGSGVGGAAVIDKLFPALRL